MAALNSMCSRSDRTDRNPGDSLRFTPREGGHGGVASPRSPIARTRSHGERGGAPACATVYRSAGHARHRPEATLLYQIVERHYPEFVAVREAGGRPLPKYVTEEF